MIVMNKKLVTLAIAALTSFSGVMAQRVMDRLDRGLVAVKTTGGVYCSWRIQADEYYDVKYNLYRDGTKVNSEPLSVSNFIQVSEVTYLSVYEDVRVQLFVVFRCAVSGSVGVPPAACVESNQKTPQDKEKG